jgi:hypothetical protein
VTRQNELSVRITIILGPVVKRKRHCPVPIGLLLSLAWFAGDRSYRSQELGRSVQGPVWENRCMLKAGMFKGQLWKQEECAREFDKAGSRQLGQE